MTRQMENLWKAFSSCNLLTGDSHWKSPALTVLQKLFIYPLPLHIVYAPDGDVSIQL